MSNALKIYKTNPSVYFDFLNIELAVQKSIHIEATYYKIHYCWPGECYLGKKEVVISTEPEFINGYEVV